MDQVLRIPENIQKIAGDIKALCDEQARVVSVKVSSNDEYSAAANVLKLLNDQAKSLESAYRTVKDPIVKEGRNVDEWFRPFTQRVDDLKRKIGHGMQIYQEEQNQIRLNAQREAEEKARLERLEIQRKADADRAKAEELRLAGDVAKAEKLESKADLKEQAAAQVVAAPVQIEIPKVLGVSSRTTWKGRVKDAPAFMQWAVANGYLHLIKIDESALNSQAKACKGMMVVPGVEWYTDISTVTRGGL